MVKAIRLGSPTGPRVGAPTLYVQEFLSVLGNRARSNRVSFRVFSGSAVTSVPSRVAGSPSGRTRSQWYVFVIASKSSM